MMWQDLVFMAGSSLSLIFLMPTLRDSMAHVPLGTSLPSATIGFIYGGTFLSLGMTFSGIGAMCTGVMWSAIATLRSPNPLPFFDDEDEPQSPSAAAPHAD
jgi:hypothetical protein